ncbi:GNAT family N-acetyltransferase [Kitasatospora kifunensis]|uniref:GNAT superfamily N-acetyltransferase n=1 Tax=Kitasatospora kifunensis TaxID=58351 RepID=A0A7W7R809_KITKI|nr:GNAT family N-acetyltransferase [Kitasatospora kifunensis]MBB4926975.1 GNAT superfamily N-acetyltransferase [Kitasatospora kifunensis]
MELRTTGYDHPDAELLTAEVQQEYIRRYGEVDVTEMRPEHFSAPHGIFVVGYLDGAPVACGGWRAKDSSHPFLLDGDAELKRMFVVPTARGRGLARVMLRHLEEQAGAAGRTRVVLETGTEQPEAVALYASEGYQPITKFGLYRDAPKCICLGKELAPR